MSKCARPDCLVKAKCSCSVCEREQYCSSSCQKLDWKIHKSICPILKKLSTKLQPYHEVIQIKDEILASKKGKDCRVLEHLLSYLEHQFGEKVTGIDFRERKSGERISNWKVEVEILHFIYKRLANSCFLNNSLSMISRSAMSSTHFKRSLSLLNPWLIQFGLDTSNQIDSCKDPQVNHLLRALFLIEQNMASVTMNSNQLDLAEGHYQRCLAYSRRYGLEGEKKITDIFTALEAYCTLRQLQGDNSGGLIFAEEAYNLVVEAYDPVHPQVQEAAGIMINILIKQGDLFDAERYAQVTYGNLRDKKNGIDQGSEVVAVGAYNLANVIYRQKGDLIKAEVLARESLRIRTLIYGSDYYGVAVSCDLLAGILMTQGKLGDETRGLLERYLALSISNHGPDGKYAAVANSNLGSLCCRLAWKENTVDLKRMQFLLAKTHYVEALRIYSKIDGPTHPNTIDASSRLSHVLKSELECAEISECS